MSSIEDITKNLQEANDKIKKLEGKIEKLEEKLEKLEEDKGNNYKLDVINQNVYLNFL